MVSFGAPPVRDGTQKRQGRMNPLTFNAHFTPRVHDIDQNKDQIATCNVHFESISGVSGSSTCDSDGKQPKQRTMHLTHQMLIS